jgi:hypothetical protein
MKRLPLRKPLMSRHLRSVLCGASVLTATLTASPFVQAQEVNAAMGALRGGSGGESTYTWSFGYRQDLTPHLGIGLSWLNEGHIPDHHRDGAALQGWYRHALFDPRLTFAAGAGPYRYYDTTSGEHRRFVDDHGLGVLYTVTASWAATRNLQYQMRINHVEAFGSVDTTSVLFGLAYQLSPDRTRPADSTSPYARTGRFPQGDEVTFLAGKTVVNSLDSQSTFAKSIEYRHSFTRHIEGTVAWMDEGHTPLTRRNGVAAQLWANEPLFGDRLSLGVGLGPYVAADHYRESRDSTAGGPKLSGLFTMSVAYEITPHIVTRLSWNRVITSYDRDTDIFLIGMGYRF